MREVAGRRRYASAIGPAGKHMPSARKQAPRRAGRPAKGSRQVSGGNAHGGQRRGTTVRDFGCAEAARKRTLRPVGNDLREGATESLSDRAVHSARWEN